MEINTSRDQSSISSINNFRKLLVNLSVLSIPYAKRMLAINNSPFWAEQVKHTKSQGFFLLYTSLKARDTSRTYKAMVIANMLESQGEHVNYKVLKLCLFLIQSTNQT